jgi:uncharacterized protein (TIGR02246 family)
MISLCRFALVFAGILFAAALLPAQEAEIRAMLANSVKTWNTGDLKAFVTDYEDSPDTTFVGRTITRGGRDAILGRYQRSYTTREKMGTLKFSEIVVRPLTDNLAVVTGRFDLTRTEAGGGNAAGRYTLIVRKSGGEWKILHDHTSALSQ